MGKKKIVWFGVVTLIIIMVLTNPTNSDFKNSISASIYTGNITSNWGIFSFYKATGISKRERRSDRVY